MSSARPPSRGPVARPPTGYRRLDTGASYQPGTGIPSIGRDTKVKIVARPITQHGMTGIKTKTQGPGRRVADRAYYESMLRNKIRDITDECNTMDKEIAGIQENSAERIHQERKKEEIIAEVREFEGRLADFNLALDKVRTSTDLSDLQHACEEIREKNVQDKKQIDALFLEKHQVEQQINNAREKIESLHDDAERIISKLGDNAMEEYRQIVKVEMRDQEEQVEEKEKELAEHEHRLKEVILELEKEEYQIHIRAMELQKVIRDVQIQIKITEEETDPNLTADQIRENIKSRAKAENRILSETNREIARIQEEIDDMNNSVQENETQVSELREYAKKAHKYEALYERDAKMTKAIESIIPNELKKSEKELLDTQRKVVGILENISAGLKGRQHGSKNHGIHGEMAFKQLQTENAANTLEHVKADLAKRKQELEKVESLDKKIASDMKQMNLDEVKMREELKFFEEVDIQERHAKLKVELMNKKYIAVKRKKNIEEQVQILAKKYEKRQEELFKREVWTGLLRQEQQLRTLAQNVFKIEQSLISKRQESDYRFLHDKVLQKTAELSQRLNEMYGNEG